jgi:protein-L-isoaspartate(D-aspartate) O-methyltransferase
MAEVDRAIFVPEEVKDLAYKDGPLPIGEGQTISQPYVVAYMAQLLELQPSDKVLEIGTGCGYNAAVLSRIVPEVYSVEIIEWLAKLAKKNLEEAGIQNVYTKHGNGYQGWPENAPYDKVILTAAAPKIPDLLKEQLKIGGKLLGPVSDTMQKLILLEKTGEDQFKEEKSLPVRFVPMTGKARE